MHCWAIIVAGGSGTRLAAGCNGKPKQFFEINGSPMYWRSALVFARIARVQGVVFVFPEPYMEEARKEVARLARRDDFGLAWVAVRGGVTRRDSVAYGLDALPIRCDKVLVHDAARPFLPPALVNRVLDALEAGHDVVIPGIAVVDTIKEVDAASVVTRTPARQLLRAIQTPQGFALASLKAAHRQAGASGWDVTDDAMLMERAGIPVLVVEGDEVNRKITTPADLALLFPKQGADALHEYYPCTGFGYDVHKYGGPRSFILGGVPIPTTTTICAHSDGDVLLHALIDAILGCMGKGDIGALFPDTDDRFDGIESGILLAEVMQLAAREHIVLTHVDLTIVAQSPKIAPYRERISANIAKMMGLSPASVNVKATTEEHLGFTGEKLGIKAYAAVSALKKRPDCS